MLFEGRLPTSTSALIGDALVPKLESAITQALEASVTTTARL